MTSLEQHIIALQQQIDQLAIQVSTLRDIASLGETNSDTPLVAKPNHQTIKANSTVGINRFRQLQG